MPKTKGKFIVIEGIDGSGKATHVRLLEQFLRQKLGKNKVLFVGFPRYYTSSWGKLVGDFLSGRFGELRSVSPYLAHLTYMLDEYTWSRDIGRPWLEKGGWVLADRYFTSNIHGIAKLKTRAKAEFRKWLWHMGWDELGIVKPDLVIFLDRAPADSMRLNRKKAGRKYLGRKKKDIAEKDRGHQEAAYREYLYESTRNKNWVSVSCKTDQPLGGDTIIIQKRVRAVIEKRLL